MGALTIRFPESLHERVRALAEQEGISMNQLAVLAVAEKVSRLDAEASYAYLDALGRLGEDLASARGQALAEAARSVLDKAAETAQPENAEGDGGARRSSRKSRGSHARAGGSS